MKLKRYLLSAEDIQELIVSASNGIELNVLEQVDDKEEDYIAVFGKDMMRVYDAGECFEYEDAQ